MWSRSRTTAAIFLAVALMLLAVHGNRVVATNDEGILLDAAQRVSGGERPYVDFWTYMTPGSYWLQAIVFRLLGISLLSARVLVIFDFSLQCALVFWLTSRLASQRIAAVTTIAFLGFQLADPSFLTAQHRWDSSTLALAGVAMAVCASSRSTWIATGATLAFAAWCTPTVGMVFLVVAGWLAFQPARRQALIPLIAGAGLLSVAAVALLAAQGGLFPLIQQMLWLRENYLVNAMPYGSIIGGYAALFDDASGNLELAIRGVLVACVALPAILPPVALLGWGTVLWRKSILENDQRSVAILLLASAAALILALSPRPDVMHLAFVVALPYVLTASAFSRLTPTWAEAPLGLATVLMAVLFSLNAFTTLSNTSSVTSPVGDLRVNNKQRSGMESLLAAVHPGEPLFVYPYMPMHYFLTQTRNPTDFSFLSPGMSTKSQSLAALATLQEHPPEWIMFMKFSQKDVLRIVPQGGSADWRYAELEDWLEQNYAPQSPKVVVSGYELRRRSVHAASSRP